ncbi:MAG: large subunit ribosomal protein [Gaiellales bacterium]|nr:large subunit ribosomal protein [Gaiellales bacterium]
MPANLRVTLVKSVVSTNPDARRTVRALGLHRIGETVELPDNPAVRGQIRAVRYLLTVNEETRAPRGGRVTRLPASEPKQPGEETES